MARMNIGVKQNFRRRRQHEGKRPMTQYGPPVNPTGGIVDLPLTFAWTVKGEGNGDAGEAAQRTNFFIPPAFDPNELVELPTSYKPDSELDPINFSDEFAEGLKIRPWAHVRVPSYLAIEEWLGGADDEFKVGKGIFRQHVPQYVGRQLPIDVSPLIPEAEYTTYGSLNQLSPPEDYPTGDGYLFD